MTRRTMTAYRLLEWGRAEFGEIDVPEPGVGELLIRVGGAGLCRTDLDLMSAPAGHFAFGPPFTLGHETAGWIEQAGSGTRLPEGTAVVVSCVHSCGLCEFCVRGNDNHCWEAVTLITRGMGLDGGLAEYVVVPEREVVALSALEPRHAAPLADAGVTSYHAITRSRAALAPDSIAVVYGIGGLGAFAVQLLRVLTAARIVAVDPSPTRRTLALKLGADDALPFDGDLGASIADITGGRGAHAQFDFVGTDETLAVAGTSARPKGRLTLCGMGGGSLPIGWFKIASGCEVVISQGGTLSDLHEVVALAESGRLTIDTEPFALHDVEHAYLQLRNGELHGRAVVEPAMGSLST